jgi:hypothetical protein
MSRDEQERREILEKYGDLLSEEEKKELLGSNQTQSISPVAPDKKFGHVNTIAFTVFFSIMTFNWLCIVIVSMRESNIQNLPIILSHREIYVSYPLLALVVIPQLLRLKWYDTEREIVYIRVLIAISLLWLLFNMIFYFTASPWLILLFTLLTLAAFSVHPSFSRIYNEKNVKKSQMLTLRINGCVGRLKACNGCMPSIIIILLRPLILLWELAQKIKLNFPNKELLFLLYLAVVSLLCLFTIIGKPWITVILILFWCFVLKKAAQYMPTSKMIALAQTKPGPERVDRPITMDFLTDIDRPLSILYSVGTGAFAIIFMIGVAPKYNPWDLSLQLAIWGAFMWNLIMSEIQIYAYKRLDKILFLYGVD